MPDNNAVEITSIVLARSLQVITSKAGTSRYLPDLVKDLRARYSFLTAPKDDDLFTDPPKGAELKHGKLVFKDETVVIDKLVIFNDGIAVDTTSSTDNSDRFLDDLLEWAKDGLPKAQIGVRYYLSHVEMRMSKPLGDYVHHFRSIGENITALLKSYGIMVPQYEPTALNLHFDQLGKVSPIPGVFYIDRRQGRPFSDNLWFSQAPLRTGDHVALLRHLG
jgi:hypothetical protein